MALDKSYSAINARKNDIIRNAMTNSNIKVLDSTTKE